MTDKEKDELSEEVETEKLEGAPEAEETSEEVCDSEESELEKLKKELEEAVNSKMRLQADFENYKKRVEKEKQSLINYAVEDMMSELLPVIDNFERALDVKETEDFKSFYDGVDMIKNQFIEALEKQGLKEIEALDAPFDPNYHSAVSQMESEDHESDTVMQVFQKGYSIKDKVIRPSMVVVSK